MKKRAYSVLTVKSVNEEKRVITGMATTPTPDRVGDIIEPKGAKFANPSPLLWMHDGRQPVGQVTFGKATADGIPFEATIARLAAPQTLADRLDEAWESVKAGLVRGVSIGFRAIEWAFMEEQGGIRYLETEILELSLVTIPCNAEATIDTIKSFDTEAIKKAASGPDGKGAEAPKPAGATAKPVKINPSKKEDKAMNYAEQIKKLLETRKAKLAEMQALMKKATDAGETLAGAEAETYDALQKEVEDLDKQHARLKSLESLDADDATPVVQAGKTIVTSEEGARVRSGGGSVRLVGIGDHNAKGMGLARVVKCIGLAKGNLMQAYEIAKSNFKDNDAVIGTLKTAIAAGTTASGSWTEDLVGAETNVYADFVSFLRPQTILGKFGTGNIPGLRNVPFNTPLISQTAGGAGYWTGEGKGKGVTKFNFDRTTLTETKVANIAVITEELLRRSGPAADALIRDELVNALKGRLDTDFIDPTKNVSAGVSPASITYGVTPIDSSGRDADAVRADIRALMAEYIAANNPPTTGVLIMSSLTAMSLALMNNALGGKEFPGITMAGGMLEGIPVITSEYVPTDSTGSLMIMVNAQDIYLGDEGGFAVDMSREASLEMVDTPSQDAGAPTASTLVSLWQTNSVGFRAERTISWKKRRTSAVAFVQGVLYGSDES